jgi:hypothetical protein
MTPAHRSAVAILRAATVRRIGERRWGPGGGHLAYYRQPRTSPFGWRDFTWQDERRLPDRVMPERRTVDLARHRRIAKAEARKLIERITQ